MATPGFLNHATGGRRVAITGWGMVSPLAIGAEASWAEILAGRSGIRALAPPLAENFPVRFAGTVPGFLSASPLPARESRKYDEFILYALAAGQEALATAGLRKGDAYLEQAGVAVGSGIGGLGLIENTVERYLAGGPRRVSPYYVPGSIISMASGLLSLQSGARGPSFSTVSACASGAHNIALAALLIQGGLSDLMLAGGAERASTPTGLAGFAAIRALSTRNEDPPAASRPWDRARDGFVLGDGAGVLVLEELEHARTRGATVHGLLAGCGMSSDAYHSTAPEPGGRSILHCMEKALRQGGVNPEQVDYINAHATSTPLGDKVEGAAIQKLLGTHAPRTPVSSTKSMTGHMLGASGAVEAIFSLMALRDQVAPPTINLDDPEPGCGLNFVAHEARALDMEWVLSNSFGFGGTNVSLLFQRFH